MIYEYDNAIAADLTKSLNPVNTNCTVKVMDKSAVTALIAQMQDDQIQFPLLCLMRNPDTPIDESRTNFTRLHKGVVSAYDPDTHNLYLEKSIPIKLGYELHILTTNTADMDEIVRELLFKYVGMYFITMTLPYESKRKVRFGVAIDSTTEITRQSGAFEYISEGTLYETIIPLRCDGAVLVSYTPKHIERAYLDPTIHVQ